MSTKPSDKKPGEYVMPEEFSFGLEERDESEEEIELPEGGPDPELAEDCEHKWVALPESQQTLTSEDKKIWTCPICGTLTNTYTWQKP